MFKKIMQGIVVGIAGIPFVLAHQSHNDHNAKEQKKRKHHPPCDPLPPYMGEDKRKASHDQAAEQNNDGRAGRQRIYDADDIGILQYDPRVHQ